jgi:hypothetical protein
MALPGFKKIAAEEEEAKEGKKFDLCEVRAPAVLALSFFLSQFGLLAR